MKPILAVPCRIAVFLLAAAVVCAQDPPGPVKAARRLFDQGKFQEALDAYQAILATKPGDLAAHLGAGRALIALGLDRTPEAVGLLEKAVRLPGAGAEAYAVLAQAYYWHGHYLRRNPTVGAGGGLDQFRFTDAAAMCEEALRRDPKRHVACYYKGLAKLALSPPRTDEAIEAFREAARLAPSQPDYHMKLAWALRDANRHEEAARAFLAAAGRSPRKFKQYIVDAYARAAEAFARAARNNLALQSLKKAYALDPKSLPLFETVWRTYGTRKETRPEGVRVLKALVKVRPSNPYPRYYLGYFYQHMSRTEDARKEYARVLKTGEGKKFSRVWAAMAEILWVVDRNAGAAERHALKALQLEPENKKAVKTLKYMITAARRDFDRSRAIDLTRKLLRYRPRNGTEWGNLGLFLREKGDTRGAIRAYEKALALAPGDAQIRTDAGKLYNDLNRNDRAEALFKEALAIDPEHTDALTNLGYFYRKHGRLKKALELFEKVVRLNPEDDRARRVLDGLRRRIDG